MGEMAKDPLERNDPMMQNLPIVTSCTFYKYGLGGGKEATQVCHEKSSYPRLNYSLLGRLCSSQQHCPPEVLPVPLVLVPGPGLCDHWPPGVQGRPLHCARPQDPDHHDLLGRLEIFKTFYHCKQSFSNLPVYCVLLSPFTVKS